jgi:hypothetical protein
MLVAMDLSAAQAEPHEDIQGTVEPAPLTEADRALAQAHSAGERVEVEGERSEYSTTFANPDGQTFNLELSAVPVRVDTGNGTWADPDPTLEIRPDGSIGPKAAAADISFSAGGDSTMASIADKGTSLSVQWPGELPVPEITRASARYPEVLPGIDLQLTASVEGFSHVLIVKTPQAAADPALRELNFGLQAQGLTVRGGAAGDLSAVDANGNEVFRAPAAHMWDSAGAAAGQGGEQRTTARTSDAGAGEPDRGVEPGEADTVAELPTAVSDAILTVTPDEAMLLNTPADAFPLYIDPPVGLTESRRTMLRSDGYSLYNWSNGDNNEGRGVGRCGSWGGEVCSKDNYTQRLYFQFKPTELAGKHVLSTTFRVTQTWSFVCDPRTVDLVRTNGFSSSTKWPGPGHLGTMASRNTNHGRGTACSPDQPDAPLEFRTSTLTSTTRKFANGDFATLNLMLKARSETDTSYWKRFRNDAVLSVTYIAKPAKPTNVGLVAGSGTVCEKSTASAQIVGSPNPTFTATVQSAPGGGGMTGRAVFDVDKRNADGSWSNTRTPTERPSSGYVGSGSKMSIAWPTTLTEGTFYRYRAWTRSYYSWNDEIKFLSSVSTQDSPGWCYFKVDTTAPKAPQITVGAPYAECLPNDCPGEGGPGTAAQLTFQKASGDSPIASVWYWIASEGWQEATPSGSAWKASFVPEQSGTVRVYATARDHSGRFGENAVIDFRVAVGDGPVARWHFDEASGPVLDSSTTNGSPQHDLALYGGLGRDNRGRRGLVTRDGEGELLPEPLEDRGLWLNGTTGYARSAGPVLETRSPYSFSAWVRLDEHREAAGAVLSQDGAQDSPFTVHYSATGKWYFGVKDAGLPTGTGYYGRLSVEEAQPGVWTHLAGTYNPQTNALWLYVNGKVQTGAAAPPGAWAATGSMQVGRYKLGSSYIRHFPGSIDEVTIWQRALTHAEIAAEARLLTSEGYAGAELVAAWDPHGAAAGSALPDAGAGYGRDLTLQGGATLDGEALVLNGTSSAGVTAGPVVDDFGSFTVTTSVEADAATLAAKPVGYKAQLVGQRTGDGSAWGLWFELTGKETVLDDHGEERILPVGIWHFGRLESNGQFSSVRSVEPAQLDGDVRLTGIHDAQAGIISLYVGLTQNDPKAFTAVRGSGDLAVGKGLSSGAWDHYLPGLVTDVRIWSGALGGQAQIAETVGT